MWDDPPEVLEPRLFTWLRIVGCAAFVWLGLLSIPVGLGGILLLMPGLPLLITGVLVTLVFCFWWVHALQLAPRFAVSLLVVSLSLCAIAVLIPPWLLQSREEARTALIHRNLRNYGMEIAWHNYYGHTHFDPPGVSPVSKDEFSPTYGLSYPSIREIYSARTPLTSDHRYSPYEP